METTAVLAASGVIFGIIGGLKTAMPNTPSIVSFGISLLLGIVFGVLGLFGLAGGLIGVEQGIIAAMGISTVNTFVNKVGNNTPPPTKI